MLVSLKQSQNAPWTSGSFVYVFQFYYQSGAGILQLAFGYGINKFGFRTYSSDRWTAWKVIE
jgi:hypothetical protein